jgi:putative tryptophan/tyrosine transport system substrate-binding protein
VRRRTFLFASAALALAAPAHPENRVRRIGWLTGGSPKSHAKLQEAFRAGLRDHGWQEGKNLAIEFRWAEGKLERLDALAAELVALKPDVIVTAANVVHAAAKRATSSIPIVMMTGADPIAVGLVTKLARPGGNITGLSGFFEATPIKMIELASALLPRGARVAVLVDANTQFGAPAYRLQVHEAAARVGLGHHFVDVTTVPEVYRALEAMKRERPAALIVLPSPMIFFLARDMVAPAAEINIPVVYPFEDSADAGGLISYAAPLAESYRRAASYVDRILRGAHPGDLPIEQPTRLSLVVNLKAAKAQRIAIPRDLVLRADRVIE